MLPEVRSRLFTLGRYLVGIGVLVYLGTTGFFRFSLLLGLLDQWPITLIGVAGTVMAVGLVALRLKIVLSATGYRISLSGAIRLTVLGLYFNNFLPSSVGGDAVKIYYAAAGNEDTGTELGTAVVVDRATGFLALLLWPLVMAPFFAELVDGLPAVNKLLWGAAITCTGVILAFLGIMSSRLHRRSWISRALKATPGGGYVQRILDTVAGYRGDMRALGAAVAVSLAAHTVTVAVVMCVAESVLPTGMSWEMVLLVPLGLAANVVPLTPGGLGVGEAALESLFALVGLEGGTELVLGWRILLFIVSLWGLVVFLRGRRQRVYSEGGEQSRVERGAESIRKQP